MSDRHHKKMQKLPVPPEIIKAREAIAEFKRHGQLWTLAEKQRLAQLYPDHTDEWLAVEFERTKGAIKTQAGRQRLRRNEVWHWTPKEDKIITDNPRLPLVNLAELLPGREWKAIQARHYLLVDVESPRWSENDETYLLEHYEQDGALKVARHLERTPRAVEAKFQWLTKP